jgi:hypothetical protein
MRLSQDVPKFGKHCESQLKFVLVSEGVSEPRWAEYFRNLDFSMLNGDNRQVKEAKHAVEALMENQLEFDKSGVQSGKGRFKEYFLCSQIEDETLPWDPEEVDW